jgi:hypothetical protein
MDLELKKKSSVKRFIETTLLFSVIFFACTQSNTIQTGEGKGRLTVHTTDAPFPINLIEKAVVTFDKN